MVLIPHPLHDYTREPNATAKLVDHISIEVQGCNILDMNEFGFLTHYYGLYNVLLSGGNKGFFIFPNATLSARIFQERRN